MTNNEQEFLRLLKSQAARRNVGAVEYCEAFIDAVDEAIAKYPGDEQMAHECITAILDAKFPKEDMTA